MRRQERVREGMKGKEGGGREGAEGYMRPVWVRGRPQHLRDRKGGGGGLT